MSPRSAARRARERVWASSSRSAASSSRRAAVGSAMVSDMVCAPRSGRDAGDGVFDGAAHERVLLLDEVDRVGLPQVGEGVALPLAGEVPAVAALDELPDDARDVHGGLLALRVDVIELGVHM